ncbi:MAG: hypothetical protein H8D95_01975 [Candidatus Endolissoclinum sp.]|nr:hypothetical protein [Candidatus Endolissoclinum sp.]
MERVSRIQYIESDRRKYLVFTCPFEELWTELVKTKHIFLDALDKPIIVIDDSFEGCLFQQEDGYVRPDYAAAFSKIHTLLSEYSLTSEHTDWRTILVYGDANIEQNYINWCKANKQERVFGKCVYRPHTLLQRSLEAHNLNPAKPNLSFKPKHFICLNGVSKPHRVKMVNLLYKKDWQLKGHISWLKRGDNQIESQNILDLDYWDQRILKLDFDKEEICDGQNQLLCPSQYRESCFDIVNETTVSDNALFLTDKTWKPILQKTPFIIHGSKNSHKHLEEYFGIKPYTDLFDYRFDTLDYNERFDSIKDDNLERLLNMDINELNEIVNSDKMQDLLEYNKKQLLTHTHDETKLSTLVGVSESGIGENLLTHPIIKSLILLGY